MSYLERRNWKAITYDWAKLESFDDEETCWICLTQREVAILKASLIPAYWTTRWENLGETKDVLEARMAMIDGKLDCCSSDGGDSYIFTLNINTLQISINQIKYDGTTVSININAPVTIWNDGGTDDREAALCMAAMSLVGYICAMTLQEIEKKYMGLAIVFAALLVMTGGIAAFGVAIIGSLLAGIPLEVARAALSDRDAQLAVACCMYEGLRNKAVTATVLADSLDACGFVVGSNAAIVRDFVDRSIQSEDTYLAMLDAAGKAFVQVSVFGINLCECGDCGICTFDNPTSDMPYDVSFGDVGGLGNPAQCLRGEDYSEPPTYPYGLQLEATFDLGIEREVYRVTFDRYAYADINPGGGTYYRGLFYYDHDMVLQDSQVDEPFANPEWENDGLTKTVAGVQFVKVRLHFSCDCPDEKILRLDNVRVFCN